jgi:glycosyltransferase involved in cell wall biosynthesis
MQNVYNYNLGAGESDVEAQSNYKSLAEMKILHVIGSMDPVSGGPCQGIRNGNSAMNKLGVNREVVSLDNPDAAFLGTDEFPVHAMGPTKGPWQYSPKLKSWLLDNLTRFDVVLINGMWLYSGFITSHLIKKLKKQNSKNAEKIRIPKLFVMPHGMLDPYFQKAKERQLKAIRNWIYWNLIEKGIINGADGVLFTCKTELLLARKTFYDYHPKKELNVGYGIAPPPFVTETMRQAFLEKCPECANTGYLLFLSRIHQKKGADLLIKAYLNILQDKRFKDKVIPKLVIAGPNLNSPFAQKLVKLVAANPLLQSAVFFPGMLTGDAKWGALYGCEAFVLPSHQENFGIAVVEALACKKPVIISNNINIWTEINDGNAGIVSTDTADSITKALNQWLTMSSDRKRKMSENAAKVYKCFFDAEISTGHLLEALNT